MHDLTNNSFHHFGIDKSKMGNVKVPASFDPVEIILKQNGSVLFYVSKSSIKNNKVFNEFQEYIKLCGNYDDEIISDYIDELLEYTGEQ